LGHLDTTRCVRTARWESSLRYPGRSRTVPRRRGTGTWAYKPKGEVAGEAVREVGVTRGTQEPRSNTSLGTVSSERRLVGDPKGVGQGKGSRWEMANRVGEQVSRRQAD
jgi:hypothetical protein